jgi:1-phosphatidylinositol-3-phosphate 5-kinase
MQEKEHLRRIVEKIESRRPNVLLVERSVSSYAQELLEKGISLVLNVKRPLLERISRCTGAQIASSIDNIASARLGQCEMFKVQRVLEFPSGKQTNRRSTKTLMFFEGCPRRLGCTVSISLLFHEHLIRSILLTSSNKHLVVTPETDIITNVNYFETEILILSHILLDL